jgi:diguanylate cyclase (GGDEF)-like protein
MRNITTQKQTDDALRSANPELREEIAELEQQTHEMEILIQMIGLLSVCPMLEEAYRIIEDQLGRLNLADAGMLYILNSSNNHLQQVAAWGQSHSDPLVCPPGDCWGLRRGRLHMARSYHANPLICPHVPSPTPADCLCLPLVAQGETLGVLHLRHLIGIDSIESSETPGSWFTPRKIQWINIITESLALAIANLMLRSTLRQQAVRDPLTGLYNRRYLEETLERELARASRSNKNVGLMMIDIDHFKQFNDTYGHPAADVVLTAVAHLLVKSVRREDLVCRYGGEEILIMLPETDFETICQRAETIREEAAQLRVQYEGQLLPQISVSIGVGIFPDHGQTQGMLIQNVDQALYRAKNYGRNRVEIVSSNLLVPPLDLQPKWQSHTEDSHSNWRAAIRE